MSQGQGFGFGLGKMKALAAAVKKAQQIQEGAKQQDAYQKPTDTMRERMETLTGGLNLPNLG